MRRIRLLSVTMLQLALTACGSSSHDAPDASAVTTLDAGGTDASEAGPTGQWSWQDVPGTICGYGQETGIAFNLGTSDNLLIYMEGGGLCFDEGTCVDNLGGGAQSFTTGYTGDTFQGVISGQAVPANASLLEQGKLVVGIFDRTLSNNPFKDWSFAYIPYCTGDFHTGSTTVSFPNAQTTGHFAGRANVEADLPVIVQAFPTVGHVVLSGSSAGGAGALFNYPIVKQAFGNTRVDLVTDSLPLFPGSSILNVGYTAWNTNAVIPAGCPQCIQSYPDIYTYFSQTYPTSSLALLSHDRDPSVAQPYGVTASGFEADLESLTVNVLGPTPNWRYFVASGAHHTLTANIEEASVMTESDASPPVSTVLGDWLTQMVNSDPKWSNTTSIQP